MALAAVAQRRIVDLDLWSHRAEDFRERWRRGPPWPDYTGSGRVQQSGLSRRLNAELAEHAEKSLAFLLCGLGVQRDLLETFSFSANRAVAMRFAKNAARTTCLPHRSCISRPPQSLRFYRNRRSDRHPHRYSAESCYRTKRLLGARSSPPDTTWGRPPAWCHAVPAR